MATIEADYVVVGAGAMGMAFTDALVDHADVHVAVVDRRHAPGGHWLDAYPFVRLHQASAFYGVASTLLGSGRLQERGPERGLHDPCFGAALAGFVEASVDSDEEKNRLCPPSPLSNTPPTGWRCR